MRARSRSRTGRRVRPTLLLDSEQIESFDAPKAKPARQRGILSPPSSSEAAELAPLPHDKQHSAATESRSATTAHIENLVFPSLLPTLPTSSVDLCACEPPPTLSRSCGQETENSTSSVVNRPPSSSKKTVQKEQDEFSHDKPDQSTSHGRNIEGDTTRDKLRTINAVITRQQATSGAQTREPIEVNSTDVETEIDSDSVVSISS